MNTVPDGYGSWLDFIIDSVWVAHSADEAKREYEEMIQIIRNAAAGDHDTVNGKCGDECITCKAQAFLNKLPALKGKQ